MKLGSFEVPEKRLIPDALTDIRKIYDAVKSDEIASKDMSAMLGYSHPTATRFYIRLNSMVSYGLLEGRGTFRVSNLGKSLAYPENERQEKILKNKAILNVSLWKELYQKSQKSPPSDNFWVQIKNITGIEPQEAKNVEIQVRKWYVEDVGHISEDLLSESPEVSTQTSQPQDLSFGSPKSNTMSQQMVQSTRQIPENIEEIPFGDDITIRLPKNNIEQAWEFAQEYMKVYLKKRALLGKKLEEKSESQSEEQQ